MRKRLWICTAPARKMEAPRGWWSGRVNGSKRGLVFASEAAIETMLLADNFIGNGSSQVPDVCGRPS
jgi:hypothetical protein